MARKALVEINVSDTDELRMQKINRNFQLIFSRILSQDTSSSQLTRQGASGSLLSNGESVTDGDLREYLKTDTAYQEFATTDSVDSVANDLKADVSWLTSDPLFTEAVTTIANQCANAAITAACADGGIIKNLIDDAVAECKRYTDSKLDNQSSPAMLSSASIEERGIDGDNPSGSLA